MTSRKYALAACLAVTAVAAPWLRTASAVAGTPRRSDRPNILFVLTDDMTLADLSTMPITNRLIGAQGATFDQFIVNDPACCPSRATILTGKLAHNTGVFSNGGDNGGFETAHRLGDEHSTIATRLHRAGYRTGLFGKYLNGYPNGVPSTYVPPGWTSWMSPVGGDPYSEYDYTLNVDGRFARHGRSARDYGTDVYARGARHFIRDSSRDDKPFFAALTVYAPHQPAVPATQDLATRRRVAAPRTASFNQADVSRAPAFVRNLPPLDLASIRAIDRLHRRRVQSLQSVDRAVASLVHTLRDAGQLDDTFIVFSSDNGFHLGQHRLPAGKYTPYESDIHVPFLVRGPGVPAGAHVSALTGNVDLAPTFEAMAGVRRPASNDGRSLLGLARDPSSAARWTREGYLIEHRKETGHTKPARDETLPLEPPDPEAPQSDTPQSEAPPSEVPGHEGPAGVVAHVHEPTHRSKDYALLRREGGLPDYDAVRTTRWLYVEYVTGDRELYDLKRDPDEIENLAGRGHADVTRRLAQRLAQLRQCAGATCRASAT